MAKSLENVFGNCSNKKFREFKIQKYFVKLTL